MRTDERIAELEREERRIERILDGMWQGDRGKLASRLRSEAMRVRKEIHRLRRRPAGEPWTREESR